MKKNIKIAFAFLLILCASYFNVNSLRADNSQQASMNAEGSGRIISLDPGSKSGLILDDFTGTVKGFHYAGLEVLEVNTDYVYIVQITANNKIIIRDIHRR
jgi:hypothetical protein